MNEIAQLAAVALLLGLLGATCWWLRRRGVTLSLPGRRPIGRQLECLERLSLGPQHTLHLVRLGETALLVASSPGGCALVRTFAREEIEPRPENGR